MEPRPGSTAALDARVGRLEGQFDVMSGKVDGIALRLERITAEQSHIASLLTTQHQAVTAELALVRTRTYDLTNLLQAMTAEPQQTPAGRALIEQITRRTAADDRIHAELSAAIKANRADTARIKTWIAAASSLVGAGIVILNFLMPLIQKAVGIT